ncbi:hypothetical protein [Heyndrickxia vini]|uniref:Uncharacterized protein n=1 Tax=Heyndrickxia vini TaxID=1476025 RepID=A0ABX7E1P4_9BACI|nr:hypothetical protein [Heyndrickxia vini]QQZ09190.1 hypothetical protein I5776_19840 [Heyndrickxia vini]
MEDLKQRIEKLESLVEDLILILGRANQRVFNLSIQTTHLENQLLNNHQNDHTLSRKNVS